ncbi:MAG: hypothetical protein IAE89_08180 [Anaerolineae bacterium]|nr:hypothetical protein [Anaerolineae bacterium]
MQFIRQIFEGDDSQLRSFTIQFPDGQTAAAVNTPLSQSPESVIAALGLTPPQPALVIMGGAGLMERTGLDDLRAAVEGGLVRFAQESGVAIVDGGTSAGVMKMIGESRSKGGCTFPLIGVVPRNVVTYPGFDNPDQQTTLDENHSHFVLTGGDAFGDESTMLAAVGWALSGEGQRRVLGVVINGGEIVKQEAYARSAGHLHIPLLVLEGSGRYADELAAAHKAQAADEITAETLLKGDLHFVALSVGSENLYDWLNSFFRF